LTKEADGEEGLERQYHLVNDETGEIKWEYLPDGMRIGDKVMLENEKGVWVIRWRANMLRDEKGTLVDITGEVLGRPFVSFKRR